MRLAEELTADRPAWLTPAPGELLAPGDPISPYKLKCRANPSDDPYSRVEDQAPVSLNSEGNAGTVSSELSIGF